MIVNSVVMLNGVGNVVGVDKFMGEESSNGWYVKLKLSSSFGVVLSKSPVIKHSLYKDEGE